MLGITNNSIKHKSFLRLKMPDISIRPMNGTQSNQVLQLWVQVDLVVPRILQSSKIDVSYPKHWTS